MSAEQRDLVDRACAAVEVPDEMKAMLAARQVLKRVHEEERARPRQIPCADRPRTTAAKLFPWEKVD